MIPESIHLINFLSHADTTVDFTDLGMCVITGSNGNGKSSLTEAITWALFGEGRARVADDFVKKGTDNCSVELVFTIEGKPYRVIRQRSILNNGKSNLALDMYDGKKWVSISGNGVKETQVKIESLLGMDYSTLVNSSVLVQGESDQFSKADPASRKTVLGKILSLDAYETVAVKVREKGREIKTRLDTLKMRSEGLTGEIDGKELILAEKCEVENQVAELTDEIVRYESFIETLRAELHDLAGKQAEKESVGKQVRDLEVEIANQNLERTQLDSRIRNLKTIMDKSGDIRDKAVLYAKVKEEYDAMLPDANKYANLVNEQYQLESKAQDLQNHRQNRLRDAKAHYDDCMKSLIGCRDRERTKLEQAKQIAGTLDNLPCADTILQDQCKLLGQALKAKSDMVTYQANYDAYIQSIDKLPDGSEAEAIRQAQAEFDGPNEHFIALQDVLRNIESLGYNQAYHKQLEADVQKLAVYFHEAKKLDDTQKQIDEAEIKMGVIQGNIKPLNEKLASLKTQHDKLIAETSGYADTDMMLKSQETALNDARTRLNANNGIIARLDEKLRRIGELEVETQTLEKQMKDTEDEIGLYGDLATMFGKNGVQAFLIEKSIPAIEAEANMLLGKLTDGLTVSLETQRATNKGTLSETLDILIHDDSGSRRYEQFSGGEKFKIDISLRIALSRLLATRAGCKVSWIAIDEGAGCLDADSLQRFLECIQVLSKEFALILVISHIDSVKESFGNRIEVTKDSEGSHVRMIAG